MDAENGTYAPGWTSDAVAMMSSRSADDRARTVLARLGGVATVVDVGCGPGSITLGLARSLAAGGHVLGIDAQASQVAVATARAARAGVANARFEVAPANALPCVDNSIDVYFSHALFEHLADPLGALAEARRVLRPNGLLVVAASDWSHARFDPYTADVESALAGHRLLRRWAGGDPDAGGRLRRWIDTAGFALESVRSTQRVDLAYTELAGYIGNRLATAASTMLDAQTPAADARTLLDALQAARRWQRSDGTWTQCWTEVVAHRRAT
jgi:SAM-dependent methyltransferase